MKKRKFEKRYGSKEYTSFREGEEIDPHRYMETYKHRGRKKGRKEGGKGGIDAYMHTHRVR